MYTNIQPIVKPVWQAVWQTAVSCIQPVVNPVVQPQLVWQSRWMFNTVVKPCLSNRLYNVVWQAAVSCIQTFNRMSNWFHNRFDNRLDVCLHDTAGCQTGCTTVVSCKLGLTHQFSYPTPRADVYTVSQKVPTFKLSVTLPSLDRFRKLLLESVWNLLQNPYDTIHLTLGMLLHYLEKLRIEIFCRCGKMHTNCIFNCLWQSGFVIHPQILTFSVFKKSESFPYLLQIKLSMSLFFYLLSAALREAQCASI